MLSLYPPLNFSILKTPNRQRSVAHKRFESKQPLLAHVIVKDKCVRHRWASRAWARTSCIWQKTGKGTQIMSSALLVCIWSIFKIAHSHQKQQLGRVHPRKKQKNAPYLLLWQFSCPQWRWQPWWKSRSSLLEEQQTLRQQITALSEVKHAWGASQHFLTKKRMHGHLHAQQRSRKTSGSLLTRAARVTATCWKMCVWQMSWT